MKAILFDLDGVLIDVRQSYWPAIQKTVNLFSGIRIEVDRIPEYKKQGGMNNDWDLTEKILKDLGLQIPKNEIIREFQKIYLGKNFDGLIRNERWLLDCRVLESIAQKYKIGIVTGRPRKDTLFSLRRFKFQKFFDVIHTEDETPKGKRKPHPYGIKRAMKYLNTENGIYIGDNVDDMTAARKAKITPVGVVQCALDGEEQRINLFQHGARFVIEDINQILEVL